MKNVRFARRAVGDLNAIFEYIAQENLPAAERTLDNIYRVCYLLAENPRLGRRRPDVGKEMRYFPVSGLNIFYTVKHGQVVVARVLHGRRDLWRALNY